MISSVSTARPGSGGRFEIDILEQRAGFLSFRASGKEAYEFFRREGGGHRFQRVPETEKRGRVQSSTVTVAVLREAQPQDLYVDESELEITTERGTGPGGQARNKTETAVRIVHVPTGLVVKCDLGRSQYQNREVAMAMLRSRLLEDEQNKATQEQNALRRDQVGTGMRGDKKRTVSVPRDEVVDHETGRRITYKEFLKGKLDLLW